MKTQLVKILLGVVVLVFTIEAKASERWETLRAINWVENPTNHAKAGRFGELGPYQFRPTTWRMHTTKPFQLAVQRSVADEIAVKHYEWIKTMLERGGVEANAFNIAMAWNCGAQAVIAGRIPAITFQYAQRVTNLIESFHAARQEVAEQETARPIHGEHAPAVDHHDDGGLRFRILLNPPQFLVAG